jgi:hypothetical protein
VSKSRAGTMMAAPRRLIIRENHSPHESWLAQWILHT